MATSDKSGSDRNCPACECGEHVEIDSYSQEEWKVVACQDCDFVYLKNPPGYEALIEEFAWEKTYVEEKQRRLETRSVSARLSQSTRWRLALLRLSRTKFEHYFENGNVLDIGCGVGHRITNTQGVPFGIEISKELHEIADKRMKEKGGHCVHAPAIDGVDSFPDNFFDGILMHSFLEHEEKPAALLERMHRIMKPQGHIYVRVPNYASLNRKFMGKKWCGFRYPDHVNYFTPKNLKQMAADYGFDFKILNPFNLMLDDNIKALLIAK